jgi:hypothetical protein
MGRPRCSRAIAVASIALVACAGYIDESEVASPDEVVEETPTRYAHVPDDDAREPMTEQPRRVRKRPAPRSDDPPPRRVSDAVIGRTVEIGCGRAFVWGDEHVGFDEYSPRSHAFWRDAIAWLADGRDCGITRGRAVFWTSFPAELRGRLHGVEIVVGGTPGPGDILVVEAGTPLDPIWLREWIDGGGALLMTIIGYGDVSPDECGVPNASLRGLGLAYGCGTAPPWDGVVFAAEHPIGRRLETENGPFENGRWVLDLDGTSRVVAWIDR